MVTISHQMFRCCSARAAEMAVGAWKTHSGILGNLAPIRRREAPWQRRMEQWRGMARFEGAMPELKANEFVVLSPEVSGAGGMSVPAELGEIGELHCNVGDTIAEDAVVAVIETCKASVEARCRASGVVKEVLVRVGDEVFELQPLLVIQKAT